MDNELTEKFLESWLKLSTSVWNNRIISERLSFNEAIVCNLLSKARVENKEEPYVPIKYLCECTKLLKSQMNKTLNNLERQGIIERLRFNNDRRIVYIKLCDEGQKVYNESHANTMEFVNSVAKIMGEEAVKNATDSFDLVAGIVNSNANEK